MKSSVETFPTQSTFIWIKKTIAVHVEGLHRNATAVSRPLEELARYLAVICACDLQGGVGILHCRSQGMSVSSLQEHTERILKRTLHVYDLFRVYRWDALVCTIPSVLSVAVAKFRYTTRSLGITARTFTFASKLYPKVNYRYLGHKPVGRLSKGCEIATCYLKR